MIKNNLKALLIHIIISFSSIFMFSIFFISTPKWHSEEAYMKHHNQMLSMAITIIFIALIIYYLSGLIFLTKQESLYKNLLSTILVTIIGSIIWVIAYKTDYEAMLISYSFSNSDLWQKYCLFNGYSLFYLDESNSKNYLLYLLFSFMPSIAMLLGLLSRICLNWFFEIYTKKHKLHKEGGGINE